MNASSAVVWPAVAAIALVGIAVHLCARRWADRQLFFVDLGRPLDARDRARSRRVLRANALLCALALAVCAGGAALAAQALPLAGLALLGLETVRAARSAEPDAAHTRFATPLGALPPLRRLVLWPLEAAHLALLALAAASFAQLLPALPASVLLHQNWRGQWDRHGSPAELWVFGALALALWGLMWLLARSTLQLRWALAPAHAQRHAELELERRALLVHLLQASIFAANLGLVSIWLGLAWGSLPGQEHWRGAGLALGIASAGVGALLPFALCAGRLSRLKQQICELAGSDALGTRPEGWRWGGLVYWAPQDDALWVPTRVGIGVTLNFARPGAWLLLGSVLLVPVLIALGSGLLAD